MHTRITRIRRTRRRRTRRRRTRHRRTRKVGRPRRRTRRRNRKFKVSMPFNKQLKDKLYEIYTDEDYIERLLSNKHYMDCMETYYNEQSKMGFTFEEFFKNFNEHCIGQAIAQTEYERQKSHKKFIKELGGPKYAL